MPKIFDNYAKQNTLQVVVYAEGIRKTLLSILIFRIHCPSPFTRGVIEISKWLTYFESVLTPF